MELAQSTLTLFDPTLDGMVLDTKKSLDKLLIPIYSQPKSISTVLQGKKITALFYVRLDVKTFDKTKTGKSCS